MSRHTDNHHMRLAALSAAGVIYQLNEMGLRVLGVALGPRNPRITIAPPEPGQFPANETGLKLCRTRGGKCIAILSGNLDGCQIEWTEILTEVPSHAH